MGEFYETETEIFSNSGVKVGIIGMVTPNITKWDSVNLKDCTVTDPVEETRKVIDEINIANEAGNRIENLTWPDGTPVVDDDSFTIAVNNYRANSQLLTTGDVFQEGDELPTLLDMDVHGDIEGVRELIGQYISEVKGGTITPETDNNWKITGNNWSKESHEKAVELLKSGALTIETSADGRTPNVKSITENDIK